MKEITIVLRKENITDSESIDKEIVRAVQETCGIEIREIILTHDEINALLEAVADGELLTPQDVKGTKEPDSTPKEKLFIKIKEPESGTHVRDKEQLTIKWDTNATDEKILLTIRPANYRREVYTEEIHPTYLEHTITIDKDFFMSQDEFSGDRRCDIFLTLIDAKGNSTHTYDARTITLLESPEQSTTEQPILTIKEQETGKVIQYQVKDGDTAKLDATKTYFFTSQGTNLTTKWIGGQPSQPWDGPIQESITLNFATNAFLECRFVDPNDNSKVISSTRINIDVGIFGKDEIAELGGFHTQEQPILSIAEGTRENIILRGIKDGDTVPLDINKTYFFSTQGKNIPTIWRTGDPSNPKTSLPREDLELTYANHGEFLVECDFVDPEDPSNILTSTRITVDTLRKSKEELTIGDKTIKVSGEPGIKEHIEASPDIQGTIQQILDFANVDEIEFKIE